jgi:hypothetical protein
LGDDLFKPIDDDDGLINLLSCGPLVGGLCNDCKFEYITDESLDLVSCVTNALADVCFICKKGKSVKGGGGLKGGKGKRNMKKQKSKSKNNTKGDRISCVAPEAAVGLVCLDPAEAFNNV